MSTQKTLSEQFPNLIENRGKRQTRYVFLRFVDWILKLPQIHDCSIPCLVYFLFQDILYFVHTVESHYLELHGTVAKFRGIRNST